MGNEIEICCISLLPIQECQVTRSIMSIQFYMLSPCIFRNLPSLPLCHLVVRQIEKHGWHLDFIYSRELYIHLT